MIARGGSVDGFPIDRSTLRITYSLGPMPYGERKKNFIGENFWARGYLVSTVGRYEKVIQDYIRNREAEDKRLNQISLWR